MIQKAAEFAAKVHAGVFRKGSRLPYIVHPTEVALIVTMMTSDPEVIAAAYLHDVIEDAGVSYEELKNLFGKRVADLVREESEDKSRTWKERKQQTIERLQTAGWDEKVIAFGDKLSNLRSTGKDYLVMKPLHADVALLGAAKVDKAGNVWFKGTTSNFQTVMAMAADTVIVETEELVECGQIPPEDVRIPGILVDYIVVKEGK